MFDVYLDTIRDLSKGKTNKFNNNNNFGVFEREKEVEIEEQSNGEVVLTNIQSIKINNPKEAASFIEKSVIFLNPFYLYRLAGLSEKTRK